MGKVIDAESFRVVSEITASPLEQLENLSGEAFEQQRRELIESVIAQSASPEKLKRLQWRIDGIIHRGNALSAAIKLNQLMFESVDKLAEALAGFRLR